MVTDTRQALLLVLLVLFAGCGSLSGSGTPTQSVTPAPAPTSTDTIGVSGTGVDAAALAAAHDAALARTNYTVTATEVVSVDGRLLRNATRRRSVARDRRAYAVVRRVNATDIPASAAAPYEAYWYNQSVTLLRFGLGPRTRYQRFESSGTGPIPDPSAHETLEDVFSAFTFRVRNVSAVATNDTRYVLRSQRVTDPSSVPTAAYIGTPRNATATAWVRADGVVTDLRLSYDATAGDVDGTAHVELRFRFSRLGNTTVEPPSWAPRAMAAQR